MPPLFKNRGTKNQPSSLTDKAEFLRRNHYLMKGPAIYVAMYVAIVS